MLLSTPTPNLERIASMEASFIKQTNIFIQIKMIQATTTHSLSLSLSHTHTYTLAQPQSKCLLLLKKLVTLDLRRRRLRRVLTTSAGYDTFLRNLRWTSGAGFRRRSSCRWWSSRSRSSPGSTSGSWTTATPGIDLMNHYCKSPLEISNQSRNFFTNQDKNVYNIFCNLFLLYTFHICTYYSENKFVILGKSKNANIYFCKINILIF
jgi:hypothetical protein